MGVFPGGCVHLLSVWRWRSKNGRQIFESAVGYPPKILIGGPHDSIPHLPGHRLMANSIHATPDVSSGEEREPQEDVSAGSEPDSAS